MNLRYSLYIALFAAISISCQKSEKKQAETAGKEPIATHEYCYLQVTGRDNITDSLFVKLAIQGDSVTGVLNWLPAEKDKMTGTLAGTISENTIKAIYTYNAEGQTSREEKLFQIDGDTLRIKNGELEEKNGLWVIKNAESLSYNEAIPRVNCAK